MASKLTPMMQHFYQVKREYPDSLIFYRMGEFYELFDSDAVTAAGILEIALTSRDKKKENSLPMCGVPVHSYEQYVNKLTKAGHKVAICEQLEDPALAKGLVKRGVTRVVTPGTVLSASLLQEEKNHFICAVHLERKQGILAVAFCDLTTGEFEYDQMELAQSMTRFGEILYTYAPAEILFAASSEEEQETNRHWLKEILIGHPKKTHLQAYEGFRFSVEESRRCLLDHFELSSLEVFDLERNREAAQATGALMSYLIHTQKDALRHITEIKAIRREGIMRLDEASIRNLELFQPAQNSLDGNSLIDLLDRTKTAMGARLLRRRLARPLTDPKLLNARYDAIGYLLQEFHLTEVLQKKLKGVGDLERIIARLAMPLAGLGDLVRLRSGLEPLEEIHRLFAPALKSPLGSLLGELDPLGDLLALLKAQIMESPALKHTEGDFIQPGIHEELDELRSLAKDAKTHMSLLESGEKEATGINSLKVGFNKVFGYYFEVSNANKHLVPLHYIRKQTLAGGERYVTEELKELEEKILSAKEESVRIEEELFYRLLEKIKEQIKRVQTAANWIARLDVLCNLASLSRRQSYSRPKLLVQGPQRLTIGGGRHPVIEAFFEEEPFTPNDLKLDQQEDFISVITGPNMGGKSTFMRQAALIVLLAQIGSYVPADHLEMTLFDRVFTRVGASDNLARGQSTFMVEMHEAAAILNGATEQSLIILDEIGRGTSTFDGISIAWAMLEYLHKKRALCLFATHYHELILLEEQLEGVRNDKVLVAEENEKILFLRKVIAGRADKSYGIQVAGLAGLPYEVILRAKTIMRQLEEAESGLTRSKKQALEEVGNLQLSFGPAEPDWVQELRDFDLNNSSPLQAMEFLHSLKERAQ